MENASQPKEIIFSLLAILGMLATGCTGSHAGGIASAQYSTPVSTVNGSGSQAPVKGISDPSNTPPQNISSSTPSQLDLGQEADLSAYPSNISMWKSQSGQILMTSTDAQGLVTFDLANNIIGHIALPPDFSFSDRVGNWKLLSALSKHQNSSVIYSHADVIFKYNGKTYALLTSNNGLDYLTVNLDDQKVSGRMTTNPCPTQFGSANYFFSVSKDIDNSTYFSLCENPHQFSIYSLPEFQKKSSVSEGSAHPDWFFSMSTPISNIKKNGQAFLLLQGPNESQGQTFRVINPRDGTIMSDFTINNGTVSTSSEESDKLVVFKKLFPFSGNYSANGYYNEDGSYTEVSSPANTNKLTDPFPNNLDSPGIHLFDPFTKQIVHTSLVDTLDPDGGYIPEYVSSYTLGGTTTWQLLLTSHAAYNLNFDSESIARSDQPNVCLSSVCLSVDETTETTVWPQLHTVSIAAINSEKNPPPPYYFYADHSTITEPIQPGFYFIVDDQIYILFPPEKVSAKTKAYRIY